MASIYKRKQDKHNRRTAWYIGYKDHTGRQRTVKGYTDKSETERYASKLEEDARLIRDGLKEPDEDDRKEARRASIATLVTEFKAYLEQRDITEKQVGEVISRLGKIVEGANFKTIASINPDAVQVYLKGLRDAGSSKQTSNHYLRAILQFVSWLVRTRKLGSNPLLDIKKLNPQTDRRHDRRPRSDEEFTRLIVAAEAGKPNQCIPGPDRAVLYVFAAWTGYRRAELASLTPSSLDLNSDPPTATVAAAYSKRRRTDTQVLHPELAKRLKVWLAARKPALNESLFPVAANDSGGINRRTSQMMLTDLQSARAKWIEEAKTDEEKQERELSDFLKYKDSQGRFADFHANRHTFITNLSRAKVSPKVAQELARHSDIRLMMGIYTHTDASEKRRAVEALSNPWECIGSEPDSQIGIDGPEMALDGPSKNKHQADAHSTQLVTLPKVDAICREETFGVPYALCAEQRSDTRFGRPKQFHIRKNATGFQRLS